MSRPSQGPHLKLKRGAGRRAMYVIRDGRDQVFGTGCGEGQHEEAQRKLAEYILAKHDPSAALDKTNPNQAKIADVLAVEAKHIAERGELSEHRKRELITVCENMVEFFGGHVVGDLNGKLQKRYASERKRFVLKLVDGKRVPVKTDVPAPQAAYRDLKMLAAAINRFFKQEVGGVVTKFSPVLPEAPQPRERLLERSEVARLIWAAWRKRRDTGTDKLGRHTSRHIARFILIAYYTGSRQGDICNAALIPTIGRGYLDLDRGVFKRKPDNKKETSKRQPTVPLPPRLLAHLRRWKRLGISSRAAVEFNGKPVSNIRTGWNSLIKDAGLASDDKRQRVVRHTLRHSAITAYLDQGVDIELVSQYCGVSVPVIRSTYRHSTQDSFKPLLAAAKGFGRRA